MDAKELLQSLSNAPCTTYSVVLVGEWSILLQLGQLYSFVYNTYIHYASCPKTLSGAYVANTWNALLGTSAFHGGNRGGCILTCGCKTRMHVFYVFYVSNVLCVFLCFPSSLRFPGGMQKGGWMQIPDARFLHVFYVSYIFYASNPVTSLLPTSNVASHISCHGDGPHNMVMCKTPGV